MKNLIVIAIAFLSIQVMAQDPQRSHKKEMKREHFKDMSAEDMATLKTKKMTLMLDLDNSQSEKVYAIVLEESKFLKERMSNREAKKEETKKLTKEEKLSIANERLDRKIAFKKQMKSILNEEQYKKFERSLARKGKRNNDRKEKRRR